MTVNGTIGRVVSRVTILMMDCEEVSGVIRKFSGAFGADQSVNFQGRFSELRTGRIDLLHSSDKFLQCLTIILLWCPPAPRVVPPLSGHSGVSCISGGEAGAACLNLSASSPSF
jgi:hypothetical protein